MKKVNVVYFVIGFTLAALLSPIVVNCSDRTGQLIVEFDKGVSGHGHKIASYIAMQCEARKINVTQYGVRDNGPNVLISFDLTAGDNYIVFSGSSAKCVGEFWLGKISKRVKQRDFQ